MGLSAPGRLDGDLAQARRLACARYPADWAQLIAEWRAPYSQDRAWLMYSANYLFHTAGVRWALDPVRLRQRISAAPEMDVVADLQPLSFVLLTHRHRDHLDLDLLRALSQLPITWVVPEPILSLATGQGGLRHASILVPEPLHPLELNGIRILPFQGHHWESTPEGKLRGVPAIAYQVEFSARRWLFPGDTRSYSASQPPAFPAPDGMFAHLWLGRSAAQISPPPLLEDFCRFCLERNPGRIVLTHIQELGRDAPDYWDLRHARQVVDWFAAHAAGLPVSPALLGDVIDL